MHCDWSKPKQALYFTQQARSSGFLILSCLSHSVKLLPPSPHHPSILLTGHRVVNDRRITMSDILTQLQEAMDLVRALPPQQSTNPHHHHPLTTARSLDP
jgi:hypothetical protein